MVNNDMSNVWNLLDANSTCKQKAKQTCKQKGFFLDLGLGMVFWVCRHLSCHLLILPCTQACTLGTRRFSLYFLTLSSCLCSIHGAAPGLRGWFAYICLTGSPREGGRAEKCNMTLTSAFSAPRILRVQLHMRRGGGGVSG